MCLRLDVSLALQIPTATLQAESRTSKFELTTTSKSAHKIPDISTTTTAIMSTAELACSYAALILADEEIEITVSQSRGMVGEQT